MRSRCGFRLGVSWRDTAWLLDGMPLELPLDRCDPNPAFRIAPQHIDTLRVVHYEAASLGGVGISTVWAAAGGPPYFSLIADKAEPGPMRAFSGEVRLRVNVVDPVRVEILDAYGRPVRTVHDALVGAATVTVSTRGLAPGLYTLKAWSADYRLSYRLEVT